MNAKHHKLPEFDVNKFITQQNDFICSISKEIDNDNAKLCEIIRSIREQIQSQWDQSIKEITKTVEQYAKPLQKLIAELKELNSEAAKLLEQYKWPISFSIYFQKDLIAIISKLDPENPESEFILNNLIVSFFSTNDWYNLDYMVSEWSENHFFSKRMNIINDCISLLKQKNADINIANVIIPALLTQIDGIFSDMLFAKTNDSSMGYSRKKGKFKELNDEQSFPEGFILMKSFICDIAFQESAYNKDLRDPFYFNRHKILHGEFMEYGTIENVIRCFCVLDYFSKIEIKANETILENCERNHSDYEE